MNFLEIQRPLFEAAIQDWHQELRDHGDMPATVADESQAIMLVRNDLGNYVVPHIQGAFTGWCLCATVNGGADE